jgi:hypothetical protein
VPVLRPERPRFANGAERQVWELLRNQLRSNDILMSGLRITDRAKDHEADVVVILPGAGVVVIEVKGGAVWHDGDQWWQHRGSGDAVIHPVDQARGTKYALRTYVDADLRWQRVGRRRVRWVHAVVVPNSELIDGFATPDCPRWSIVDRTQLKYLAGLLWDIAVQQETGTGALDEGDAALIAEILRGRGPGQRSVVAIAEGREAEAQRLTQEQAVILGATKLLRRVEVRGGAGSGKTWLAVEQARRLTEQGERVALLCYSRGLAAYLRRHVDTFKRKHQPAYVGEFHGLGRLWGAETGSDDDSDFWENRLPAQMLSLADQLPSGQKFDSIVIDEAQDFADSWWPVLIAALKDQDNGGVFAFSDGGQRVFARYGEPPVPLVPLLLDHNMRKTRQIIDAFNPLAPLRMRLVGGDGPDVRFTSCRTGEALATADEEAMKLLDEGWRPEDVALLATGSRHPVQVELQSESQESYWESFWAKGRHLLRPRAGLQGVGASRRCAGVQRIEDQRPLEGTPLCRPAACPRPTRRVR